MPNQVQHLEKALKDLKGRKRTGSDQIRELLLSNMIPYKF